ncbi:hypothetical protein PR048_026311 [Dryococelus australis]|uniref:Uncharacterized protein n=1 Tax=Dryococelus australis TaxID=614101 RepID=A0ABQ9GL00_9NEOP|nr:hypothetical protein PR048_026311 [Dryococelus australis]
MTRKNYCAQHFERSHYQHRQHGFIGGSRSVLKVWGYRFKIIQDIVRRLVNQNHPVPTTGKIYIRSHNSGGGGGLDYSPPTKANRARFPAGPLPDLSTSESCWTMPLVGRFSRGSPALCPLWNFGAASLPHRFALIGSSRPRCKRPPKTSRLCCITWASRRESHCKPSLENTYSPYALNLTTVSENDSHLHANAGKIICDGAPCPVAIRRPHLRIYHNHYRESLWHLPEVPVKEDFTPSFLSPRQPTPIFAQDKKKKNHQPRKVRFVVRRLRAIRSSNPMSSGGLQTELFLRVLLSDTFSRYTFQLSHFLWRFRHSRVYPLAGDRDKHIKSPIASTSKALNGRAVLPPITRLYETFNGDHTEHAVRRKKTSTSVQSLELSDDGVKAVHDKVSSFEMNLRKKATALHAYVLMGALTVISFLFSRKWESSRTVPLVGGFSRGSPVSPALSVRRRSIFTSITIIDFQDLGAFESVNSRYMSDFKQCHALFLTSLEQSVRNFTLFLHPSIVTGNMSLSPDGLQYDENAVQGGYTRKGEKLYRRDARVSSSPIVQPSSRVLQMTLAVADFPSLLVTPLAFLSL